jgi:hypothetical protein
MTILFDTTRTVKAARRTRKPFGAGIAPAGRPRAAAPTADDRAWWAQESNRDARDYEVIGPGWDVQAELSAARDRLEAGYCC